MLRAVADINYIHAVRVVLKDERPTSNIERPTSNEKQTSNTEHLTAFSAVLVLVTKTLINL